MPSALLFQFPFARLVDIHLKSECGYKHSTKEDVILSEEEAIFHPDLAIISDLFYHCLQLQRVSEAAVMGSLTCKVVEQR